MKTSKYFSIIFLIILFTFSSSIYINYIFAHLNKKVESSSNSITEAKKCSNYIDWKKAYPIDKKDEINRIYNKSNTNNKQEFYSKVKKVISNVDSCSKDYLPFKMKFIEFGHYINKLIGGNMFLNLDGLIKFHNGYLGYLIKDKDSFEEDGKRTVDFAKYLEKENIKFGYILCPSKFSKFKKELPKGMVDYSNENADSFLKVLYENNINVLDLREDLNKEFPNHFDAFFKTDHHWKPETGFWGTQKIIKFLNQKHGQNLDDNIVKKENYNFKTYPKLFLGSQGKKVTLSFAEPEDFTLITPKFDTNFYFEAYCRDIKKEGPFEKSLLELKNLEKNYYEINTYGTYLGANNPVVKIMNKNQNNKKKLLIIQDSFICVLAPFLANVFEEILLVDVRRKIYFNGSIKKLIKDYKPDIVLIIYHSGVFNPKSEHRPLISNFD